MKKYFKSKKLFVLGLFLSASLPVKSAALPTFDYSNLITAIDSTMKAVEFYNSTLVQMKGYADQLEKLTTAINEGDFESIANGIKGVLKMVGEITDEINQIKAIIEDKRRESEIESKKATLEILNILTKPSLGGIRGYIERYEDDMDSIELVQRVASDTKDALEILFNDYSDTADEAIKGLENKYLTIARNLSDNFNELKENQSSYSYSMTAQQTLAAFLTELSTINRTLDNTKEGIETLKKDASEGKKEIKDKIESWQNILEKLDGANRQNKALKNDSEELENLVESMK